MEQCLDIDRTLKEDCLLMALTWLNCKAFDELLEAFFCQFTYKCRYSAKKQQLRGMEEDESRLSEPKDQIFSYCYTLLPSR